MGKNCENCIIQKLQRRQKKAKTMKGRRQWLFKKIIQNLIQTSSTVPLVCSVKTVATTVTNKPFWDARVVPTFKLIWGTHAYNNHKHSNFHTAILYIITHYLYVTYIYTVCGKVIKCTLVTAIHQYKLTRKIYFRLDMYICHIFEWFAGNLTFSIYLLLYEKTTTAFNYALFIYKFAANVQISYYCTT